MISGQELEGKGIFREHGIICRMVKPHKSRVLVNYRFTLYVTLGSVNLTKDHSSGFRFYVHFSD